MRRTEKRKKKRVREREKVRGRREPTHGGAMHYVAMLHTLNGARVQLCLLFFLRLVSLTQTQKSVGTKKKDHAMMLPLFWCKTVATQ